MASMALAPQAREIVQPPAEAASAKDCHGNPTSTADASPSAATGFLHPHDDDGLSDATDPADRLSDCCQTDACNCGCAQHATAVIAHAGVAIAEKGAGNLHLPGNGHARSPPERLIRPPIA